MQQTAVLVILDGYGLRDEADGNAIAQADTPHLDQYFQDCAELDASGPSVGLPQGMMGSSEVGHLNIGAGRVVKQEVTLINDAIRDGSFFEEAQLLDAARRADDGATVHIMGLLSDEGVHAHTDHLYALLEFFAEHGVEPNVHAFTDGRDTAPQAAAQYFEELDEQMEEHAGRLATIMGRYYAMDRDGNWDRTQTAYETLVDGEGTEVESWQDCLDHAYSAGETDEFITPRMLDFDGIEDGDVVICYNYRTDRPRQLTKAFVEEDFSRFSRDYRPVHYKGMVEYYDGMPAPYLYEKRHPETGLGRYLSDQGYTQHRVAESEKEAHVTYFFNGEVDEPFGNEQRMITDSPDVATYDEAPEMAAATVADTTVSILDATDVAIVNFANCDMVGHTGDFDATVTAVEAVDTQVARIVDAVLERDGLVLITADHGNAELMEDDGPVTSHTLAPVPLSVVGTDVTFEDGKLGDVASTFLCMLEEDIPQEMTGDVLLA